MSKYRDPGTIESVRLGREDHGIMTCVVFVHFDEGGGVQGYGGLALDGPDGDGNEIDLSKQYVEDLCATFDVKALDDLVGKRCVALRCFPEDLIEGLIAPSGKRFTNTSWRRKHWPEDKAPDPLASKRQRVIEEIGFLRKRLREEEEKLLAISKKYRSAEID